MDNLKNDPSEGSSERATSAEERKATTTFNMDTGKREPLKPDNEEDESAMDFGSGSGGGSAGDGGAS